MTTGQLNRYRERLWNIVARVHDDASAVSKQVFGESASQATGGLSHTTTHLTDMGTESYLQELNAALLENEEHLVEEALAAIKRIDEGRFGRCENCGQSIIKARLDAIPFARYCAPCAETVRPGPAG